MTTVHTLGSINIDHVYRVPHLVRPGETLASRSLETVLGGKGANQSVALARAGAPVRHLGRLGKGDGWARDALAESGVDVAGVELVAGPSGHAIIQVDDAGENAIVLHGGANLTLDEAAVRAALESAAEGDWLLLQNEISGLGTAFDVAAERGLHVAFNPAPMGEVVATLELGRCALLIVNETEAAMLARVLDGTDGGRTETGPGEAEVLLEALAARLPGTRVCLTLGARGARLAHGDARAAVAAPRVEAVDTTGAGDTFVGYLLAAFVAGNDDERALARACAAAALSVTRAGATPSIPTSASVDAFLAGGTGE